MNSGSVEDKQHIVRRARDVFSGFLQGVHIYQKHLPLRAQFRGDSDGIQDRDCPTGSDVGIPQGLM